MDLEADGTASEEASTCEPCAAQALPTEAAQRAVQMDGSGVGLQKEVRCELERQHPGAHFANLVSSDDGSAEPWLLWFEGSEPQLAWLMGCPDEQVAVGSTSLCILPQGHVGSHCNGDVWWGIARQETETGAWRMILFSPSGDRDIGTIEQPRVDAVQMARAALEAVSQMPSVATDYGWKSIDGSFAISVEAVERQVPDSVIGSEVLQGQFSSAAVGSAASLIPHWPSPPGWYADPWRVDRLRWWDGGQWTAHTQT